MSLASISGRIDTWCTAKCIHLQTRIVGETAEVIVVKDILRFLQGISLNGISCLRNILMTTDIGK